MKASVKLFCFVCGLVALSGAQAAEKGSKKHRFDAEVHVGNVGLGAAKFELACSAGKGGSLSLSLIFMRRDAAKSFALDEFEGPDGVGESRALAQWGVDTRGPATNLDSNISGWYGVDGDGFILSTAANLGKSTALPDFVRHLTSDDALRLRLRVTPPHGGDPLQASAALSGAQAELARVAADCLLSK
jgi:hypothetical protein